MQQLYCDYDEAAGGEPVVGLIVLQSDLVMEQELRAWLAPEVRLLHTRIPNSPTVSAASLCAMADELTAAAARLPTTVDYAAIAYGCTSASTLIGEARICELVHRVFPEVTVTNPITALTVWLERRGLERIAMLTPYAPDISTAIVEHLEHQGIEVVHCATFNETRDDHVARIAARSVLEAMVRLGRHARCEAVFGSCTNLRALTVLREAQQRIGKPVMTSNSVLAWHLGMLTGTLSTHHLPGV